VQFSSQKIKKQKLTGIPQRFQMAFDRKSNRYIQYGGSLPIFNFDKHSKKIKGLTPLKEALEQTNQFIWNIHYT